MSLNQSMNISIGSMKNYQYALTVVSQNIANLHVDGYHRQRVDFQTNRYTTDCENVISTIKGMNGASIASLSDYIDKGMFDDLINKNSDAQYYNTLADALQGLEDISDDLGDNGLNALLNEFFQASANLEQFPSDMTVRQQYVLAAQNVCEKFNDIAKKYDSLQEDKFQEVSSVADTINGLLSDLASANVDHAKNNQSSQTQVKINEILEQLSNYMDITTDTNANGTVNIYLGDIALVEGGVQKFDIKVDFDANNPDGAVQFSLQSLEKEDFVITEGVTESFNSGSMKAYIDFLNGSGGSFANINDMKEALNSAANAFALELNKIQTYDDGDVFAASITTDTEGNLILEKATEAMFTTSDGSAVFDAGNISVNPAILENPFLVSAARIDLNNFKNEDGTTDASWINAIGNSDNATEITDLQNKNICSYGGGQNNCTLGEFLTSNAAKNGQDAASIIDKADTYNDLVDSAATNYANIVGVNLDEELADMIKYQRSYEASAKLFSTINDLMGTIINMV